MNRDRVISSIRVSYNYSNFMLHSPQVERLIFLLCLHNRIIYFKIHDREEERERINLNGKRELLHTGIKLMRKSNIIAILI